MNARTLLRTLPLAFSLASTAALAQQADQRGWYAGLSVGQSKVKFDESFPAVGGVTASSVSKDETDTAYKLYAGYRLHRNFAVEGGWTDLGEWTATRNITAPAVGSLRVNIEASGWHVDALGIFPLQNNFAFFGKLGGIYTTTKSNRSATGAVVLGGSPNREKSEFNLKWGIGASYAFIRSLAARLEFEQVHKIGDSSTGEGDVQMFSIGLTYHF
jgi:OOP family OmpA-OmpF porin